MKAEKLNLKKEKSLFNKIYADLKSYHPPKVLAFLFFVIPIFIALSRAIYLDNDFWFLVNNGKYIVQHGFPTVDPFVIHQNFSLVVQQWLTDVIYYYIHLIFDGWGIILFTMIQFILILYLGYRLCLLVSENRVHLSVFLTFIIGFLLSLIFVRSRPQMFDFIIFLAEFYCLELYIRRQNKRYLYLLPILSLLLINLHASSFFLLFLFMFPYLIDSFRFQFLCFESENYDKKPLFLVLIIMFLVGFINPYGISAINYIFTSYGNHYINDLVMEMFSPTFNTLPGITIYVTIFLVFFAYIANRKEKIKIRYFCLLLGTTVLALTSIKGFSFFIIASFFPLADYLKKNFRVYSDQFYYSRIFKIKYVFIVIIFVFALGNYAFYQQVDFYATDVSKITQYLENEIKGDRTKLKIYTNYNNGGFLEYKGFKVYLDARAEVFLKANNHKKDIIKEFYLLQHGELDIEQFLRLYDFDYLVVSKEDYLYRHYFKTNKNKNYQKVYTEKTEFDTTYLYQRS